MQLARVIFFFFFPSPVHRSQLVGSGTGIELIPIYRVEVDPISEPEHCHANDARRDDAGRWVVIRATG